MKLTRLFNISLVLSLLLAGTVWATPYVIDDSSTGANTYWGAVTPSGYNDVVGNLNKFDISKMEVSTSNGNLVVTIFSEYFDNVGELNTGLGDLFISTDGWTPYGIDAHHTGDNADNGTSWEYALVGNKLYTVETNNIIKSYANPGYLYRKNQEVKYNNQNDSVVKFGDYSLNTTAKTLTYTIGLTDLGLSPDTDFNLGFHWAMTCANDVIEGSYNHQVPEPATLALLGFGLLGMAVVRRRGFDR